MRTGNNGRNNEERDFIVAWTMDTQLNSEDHSRGGSGVTETRVRAASKDEASERFKAERPKAFVLVISEG